MYHYIIDQSRLSTRNLDKLLGEVYGHLTEYQINGEVHRVTRLRNLHELAETALHSGARTIVAVGDDQTFLQLVEILHGEENAVLGFVPLGRESQVREILGLGNLSESCRAIAQRRIEEFDLGQINRTSFFTHLSLGLPEIESDISKGGLFSSLGFVGKLKVLSAVPLGVRVDRKFVLSTQVVGAAIFNTRIPGVCEGGKNLVSHRDGRLDLMLIPKLSVRDLLKYRRELLNGCLEKLPGVTILHGREFELEGPRTKQIFIGSVPMAQLPVTVSTSPYKLRSIVGKSHSL